MIVAIQQPEHLPWMGFFNKMAQCDLYVYLDNVQFKKRYFENRNKIQTSSGLEWLTVPVKTKEKYTQKINEVMTLEEETWKRKYLGTLERAYGKHPFWKEVKALVYTPIEAAQGKLVELNLQLIERCREYLNITTPTVLASNLCLEGITGSELIFAICKQLGAKVYISGPDGRNYLALDKFHDAGIAVAYHDFKHPEYPQAVEPFTSHLSIIDLVANCGSSASEIINGCYAISIPNND